MYRAIIYGFDGVIRQWDGAEIRSIEERHALPAGAIADAAYEPSLYERALTGYIPDETWRRAVRNTLVRAHGEPAAAAVEEWAALTGRVAADLTALITELRKRLRTGLLANATTRLETDLQFFTLDKAFDVVVSSARTGFAKPDPRMYRVAAVRLGFRPEQCLYVDLLPEELEAARNHGMTALTFEGVESLRAALQRLGVDDS